MLHQHKQDLIINTLHNFHLTCGNTGSNLISASFAELDTLEQATAEPNATLVIDGSSTLSKEGYHMDADTVTDLVSSGKLC